MVIIDAAIALFIPISLGLDAARRRRCLTR
jgi:hypothetical protein